MLLCHYKGGKIARRGVGENLGISLKQSGFPIRISSREVGTFRKFSLFRFHEGWEPSAVVLMVSEDTKNEKWLTQLSNVISNQMKFVHKPQVHWFSHSEYSMNSEECLPFVSRVSPFPSRPKSKCGRRARLNYAKSPLRANCQTGSKHLSEFKSHRSRIPFLTFEKWQEGTICAMWKRRRKFWLTLYLQN